MSSAEVTEEHKRLALECWHALLKAGIRYPGNGPDIFAQAIADAEARGAERERAQAKKPESLQDLLVKDYNDRLAARRAECNYCNGIGRKCRGHK